MAEIDHTSPIPLYYQLKLLLQQQILTGKLQPGDQIPTEAEFARRRYLCSLTELDAPWVEAVRDGFYPSLRLANSYRGEQYAVPTNADATVLWYRRDWLAAEALAPPATFLERVGFVPVPAGPHGSPATLVGGMTYGVYRQSAHPQEALGLLKLALTPPVLKTFSLQTGQNPANIPVAETIHPDEDAFLERTAPLFAAAERIAGITGLPLA